MYSLWNKLIHVPLTLTPCSLDFIVRQLQQLQQRIHFSCVISLALKYKKLGQNQNHVLAENHSNSGLNAAAKIGIRQ